MPLGLIARLRRCRRPAVMIAAGLIAAQAVLAGPAIARAALVLTPNLADNGAVPTTAKNQHRCCISCLPGAAPATLPAQQIVLRFDRCRTVKSPIMCAASILVAPRSV